MNELLRYVAKNHDRIARSDRESLVRIANQIDALKESAKEKKDAVKQAISQVLDGLERIAQTKHYYTEGYTSPYTEPENREILQRAVIIAKGLLQKA